MKLNNHFTPSYTVLVEPMKGKDKHRLDVKVKFTDGRVYHLAFVDARAAYEETDSNELGCLAIPAMILVDKVSMDKVKKVIGPIIESGFFERLMPENG